MPVQELETPEQKAARELTFSTVMAQYKKAIGTFDVSHYRDAVIALGTRQQLPVMPQWQGAAGAFAIQRPSM